MLESSPWARKTADAEVRQRDLEDGEGHGRKMESRNKPSKKDRTHAVFILQQMKSKKLDI